MENPLFIVLPWGFLMGLVMQPILSYAAQIGRRLFSARPIGLSQRTVAPRDAAAGLMGGLLGIVAFAVIALGGSWLLGLTPLQGAYPLAAVAFITGIFTFRLAAGGFRRDPH